MLVLRCLISNKEPNSEHYLCKYVTNLFCEFAI